MMTDEALFYLKQANLSYRAIAAQYGLSEDSVRSRVSRYRRELVVENDQLRAENERLKTALVASQDENIFGHDLGKPWRLNGDWIVVGDVHLNTTNKGFMQRPLQVAERMLTGQRRLMISGDLLNADSWSTYDSITPLPSFGKELRAARYFFDMYLEVFDEIWVTQGNHDRRIQKQSKNAISPEDLMRMISHDPRIKVSHWGHAVIDTPTGEWRCTHGSEFSVNTLVVADQMAQKYKQHIISHHQHHCSIGWDRYKRFVIIDNGGLFDEDSLAYVMLDDNKRPRMANGFTALVNGTPYLFGQSPMTDWSWWIQDVARKQAA
jgi:DNA-binding Lrp family transcriptional regulator